jgi:hypothetical protein
MDLARPALSAILATLCVQAMAFEACQAVPSAPTSEELDGLRDGIIGEVPAKFHSLAVAIKLITRDDGESLIPFAREEQGIKLVVLPSWFAKVLCATTFATFLEWKFDHDDSLDEGAKDAARCLDAGGSLRTCLINFASDWQARDSKRLAEVSVGDGNVAFGLFVEALHEVLMHEYAHHFLDHFERIGHEITHEDGEFEADLFAIMNGAQVGDHSNAMLYFFHVLESIEGHTRKLTTASYESSYCRCKNVVNIVRTIGLAPLLLLDASAGGNLELKRNSPSKVRSYSANFVGKPPPLMAGSCGHIAGVALDETFEEMKQLYDLVQKDVDLLFGNDDGWKLARVNRLVEDLSQMSGRFRYLNGLAAVIESRVLFRWDGNHLPSLIVQLDLLNGLHSVAGNFPSSDFGRLLLAKADGILGNGTTLTLQQRIDQSLPLIQQAVAYNPHLAEAWTRLAFIAFKRGDCAEAARFADRIVETHNPHQNQDNEAEHVRLFAIMMKNMADYPDVCKAKAARFHSATLGEKDY